ncbi:hypothetical protein SAY86_017405 [Trapa natans]|uniref:U6 snRNA-associated Sm-like protein LSm1 n=1 Tax=Trapa natans TaxID=22666 RepID=A0AAN7M536_TRANT|nr:hypothetical protein SAY86_017405 [Trapa natans]
MGKSSSMSWARNADIYFSASLATYLDSKISSSIFFLMYFYFLPLQTGLHHYANHLWISILVPLGLVYCIDWVAFFPHLRCSSVLLLFTIYSTEKLLVLLSDGRKLVGILRSFDQFVNAVLQGAYERVIVGDLYCDISLGLYVIRGENVVLAGELDLEKDELPSHMTRVSLAEIKMAEKVEREALYLKGTMRKMMKFLDVD